MSKTTPGTFDDTCAPVRGEGEVLLAAIEVAVPQPRHDRVHEVGVDGDTRKDILL